MNIIILIFERITALDAIGPYEVLSRLPGARVQFVAEQAGPVRTDNGFLGMMADAALDEVSEADVLLVPGGHGTRALVERQNVLDWVKAIDATSKWTTSVCTGSLVLGAAGLLKGLKATTHWSALEQLAGYGADPVSQRVVTQGKVVTAAGVSAGIDMALSLVNAIAGPQLAQAIQLGIEYDPQPPFNAGSLDKAPKEVVALVRAALSAGS